MSTAVISRSRVCDLVAGILARAGVGCVFGVMGEDTRSHVAVEVIDKAWLNG